MTVATNDAPRGKGLPRGAFVSLALLVVLGPLTSDLYLPAFPRIAEDLQASAAQIQASLSSALLGVALGQLVFGPASDRFGRKRLLILATGVLVAASVAIAVVGSIEWMLVLRLIQGFGGAGGAVIAIAIARDSYNGSNLVGVLARLSLLSGLAPIAAPFVGSLLLHTMDWRGIFVVLAIYGSAIALACAFALPETLEITARPAETPNPTVFQTYAGILGSRAFASAALISSMLCTGVFAYVSASPFIFQNQYGLTPSVYGIVFAVNAAAFAVGTQFSAIFARRHPPQRMLQGAIPLGTIAGVACVGAGIFHWGFMAFGGASFLFLLVAGFCLPLLQVMALQENGRQAGTAASVLGFANFAIASVVSPLPGVAGPPGALSLGLVLLGVCLLAAWGLRLMPKGALKHRTLIAPRRKTTQGRPNE